MSVKVKGNLPSSERNGLATLESQLIRERYESKPTIAVVVLNTTSAIETADSGWRPEPVLSITHVEPITDEVGKNHALNLLRRSFEARTGKTTLDFPEGDAEVTLELGIESGEYFTVSAMIPDDRTLAPIAHLQVFAASSGHLIGERHVPAELNLLRSISGGAVQEDGRVRYETIEELPAFLAEAAAIILLERGDDAVDAEVVEDAA